MPIPERTYPNLIEAIKSCGYSATAARKEIAGLLDQWPAGFTVEALSDQLPTVGRATVYRTIKLFIEAGVVCKLAKTDRLHRYIICGVGHHHHSVCIQCGRVEALQAVALEKLIGAISADIPGEVIDHRFEFYLMCEYCSTKKPE